MLKLFSLTTAMALVQVAFAQADSFEQENPKSSINKQFSDYQSYYQQLPDVEMHLEVLDRFRQPGQPSFAQMPTTPMPAVQPVPNAAPSALPPIVSKQQPTDMAQSKEQKPIKEEKGTKKGKTSKKRSKKEKQEESVESQLTPIANKPEPVSQQPQPTAMPTMPAMPTAPMSQQGRPMMPVMPQQNAAAPAMPMNPPMQQRPALPVMPNMQAPIAQIPAMPPVKQSQTLQQVPVAPGVPQGSLTPEPTAKQDEMVRNKIASKKKSNAKSKGSEHQDSTNKDNKETKDVAAAIPAPVPTHIPVPPRTDLGSKPAMEGIPELPTVPATRATVAEPIKPAKSIPALPPIESAKPKSEKITTPISKDMVFGTRKTAEPKVEPKKQDGKKAEPSKASTLPLPPAGAVPVPDIDQLVAGSALDEGAPPASIQAPIVAKSAATQAKATNAPQIAHYAHEDNSPSVVAKSAAKNAVAVPALPEPTPAIPGGADNEPDFKLPPVTAAQPKLPVAEVKKPVAKTAPVKKAEASKSWMPNWLPFGGDKAKESAPAKAAVKPAAKAPAVPTVPEDTSLPALPKAPKVPADLPLPGATTNSNRPPLPVIEPLPELGKVPQASKITFDSANKAAAKQNAISQQTKPSLDIPALPEVPKGGLAVPKLPDLASNIPAPSVSKTASSTASGGKTVLSVSFGKASTVLSKDLETQVRTIAQTIAKDSKQRVKLLSYTSAEGQTEAYARRISLQRAIAVRNIFTQNGVDGTRVVVQVSGEDPANKESDRVDIQKLN